MAVTPLLRDDFRCAVKIKDEIDNILGSVLENLD